MSRRMQLVLAGLLTLLIASVSQAQDERELKRPVLLDPYGDRLPAGALARMGTLRFRHGSPIGSLVFSPNGKVLATAGADQRVRLWDFATGQELRDLVVSPVDNQVSLAFSPDGKLLALGAGSPRLFLWDLTTGKELHRFEELHVSVSGVAFSADGKTLATTGNNAMVHLWDVASGKETQQLQWKKEDLKAAEKENGLIKAIRAVKDLIAGDNEGLGDQFFNSQSIAYSNDGKLLVVGGFDGNGQGRIRLWDAVKNKPLREWSGQQGTINKLSFSPDNKLVGVLAENLNVILVFEVGTGKELRRVTGDGESVAAFAFSADSKSLAYAGAKGIHLIEVASGKELRRLEEARSGIFSLAFAPDGKALAAGGRDCIIRTWDTATWREQHPYGGHDAGVSGVVYTADGTRLVTTGADRTIRVWEPQTGKEMRRFVVAEGNDDHVACKAVFSADGKLLASGSVKLDPNGNQNADGQVRIFDLDSGKVIRKLAVPEMGVAAVAFAPGNKIVASAWLDGNMRLHDIGTGKELRQFRFRQDDDPDADANLAGNIALAFSPDGKLLATRELRVDNGRGNEDIEDNDVSRIRLWEVTTGKLRRSFDLKGLSVNPAQRVLFNRFAMAIDLLEDHGQYASLAFSPDGKSLALPCDENIHLINLATGKEVRRFGGHQVNPATAIFSPDGRTLAAGTFDGSMRIWDVDTGTVLSEFAGHRNTIQTLAFSGDGKQLVSGGADTTALVWDLPGLIDDQRVRPVALSPSKLDACWTDLAADDATRADGAIRQLAEAADQAVPFLGQMLKPRGVFADAKRIDKLIADLDSNQFVVRERAMQDLEKLGRLAEPALRKALTTKQPSLELRRRMDRLLEKLDAPTNSPDLLRSLRALEVLEQIGTPQARQIIEALAKGQADDELTQQAQAALERLSKRP